MKLYKICLRDYMTHYQCFRGIHLSSQPDLLRGSLTTTDMRECLFLLLPSTTRCPKSFSLSLFKPARTYCFSASCSVAATNIQLNTRARAHTHTHSTHAHTCTHAHTHARTHAHTYAHTHTHSFYLYFLIYGVSLFKSRRAAPAATRLL